MAGLKVEVLSGEGWLSSKNGWPWSVRNTLIEKIFKIHLKNLDKRESFFSYFSAIGFMIQVTNPKQLNLQIIFPFNKLFV